jgi:glucosamine-6-phosphate deaminase
MASLSRRTIEANARFFGSADEVPEYAITMGIRTIMKAPRIVLVVSGVDKADILYRTVNGPITRRFRHRFCSCIRIRLWWLMKRP